MVRVCHRYSKKNLTAQYSVSDVRSCDLYVYHQSDFGSDPGMTIYDVCVSFSSIKASCIMLLFVYIPQ